MKILKLPAAERGVFKNSDFQGFTLFNLGERGTKRPDNFGPLYVFNDDILFKGSFLGMHPHSNVEIVTIMLEGEESHQDTLGIHEKYHSGDVQLISAGRGIRHSGGNTSSTIDARHLQIWIQPSELNTEPKVSVLKSYDEPPLSGIMKLLVSPDGELESLKINQQIWIYLITMKAKTAHELISHKMETGVMIYIIDGGGAKVVEENLNAGDTLFLTGWDKIDVISKGTSVSILVIETVV